MKEGYDVEVVSKYHGAEGKTVFQVFGKCGDIKKTETAFFNGYISQNGEKLAIPTPANDMVVTVISEIENGKREMGDPIFRP